MRVPPSESSRAVEKCPLTHVTSMVLSALLSWLGLTRSVPSPTAFGLAGCERPCNRDAKGRVHDHWSRQHARTSLRQQAAPARSEFQQPAHRYFDATKEYTSENLVLFWQIPSVFCQWTPSTFIIDQVAYVCAEQYMMAEKAKLFGDEDTWRQIMATEDPRAHKNLGRMISGYDQRVWDEHKRAIVTRGNYAKFTQNPSMGQHLLDTGEKVLAEASPFDSIWGIGLRADDPAAWTPASWRGQNLLGQILQHVRTRLIAEAVARGAAAPATSYR